MRLLVGIPTLSRVDLLVRNRGFLEGIRPPDLAIVLENGGQQIDVGVPVVVSRGNLGVSGSWNWFLRRAFVEDDFDGLVLLQDDIVWDAPRLEAARALLADRRDVDLFLSYLQFSVQVHRPENLRTVGFYDERFHPAYCEDDDYAIRMTRARRIYERFETLDPLPGSQIEGTPKPILWRDQNEKLIAKWGPESALGVNIPNALWYKTNRNFLDRHPK